MARRDAREGGVGGCGCGDRVPSESLGLAGQAVAVTVQPASLSGGRGSRAHTPRPHPGARFSLLLDFLTTTNANPRPEIAHATEPAPGGGVLLAGFPVYAPHLLEAEELRFHLL